MMISFEGKAVGLGPATCRARTNRVRKIKQVRARDLTGSCFAAASTNGSGWPDTNVKKAEERCVIPRSTHRLLRDSLDLVLALRTTRGEPSPSKTLVGVRRKGR